MTHAATTHRHLVSRGALDRNGHAAARLRQTLRLLTGRRYLVTQRELTEAISSLQSLIEIEDSFRWLDAHRDRANDVLAALLLVEAGRARRASLDDVADRLDRVWRQVRLMLPVEPLMAELLDVGAYQGGLVESVRRTERRDPDYVAIDLDPSNAPGSVSVSPMDATALDLPSNSIGQAYLLDVLEHLHGYDQVRSAIGEAVRVARDLAYFECPDFGDVDYLARQGIKWCWSDWTGHTMPVTAETFHRAVEDLCLNDIADVRIGETVYRTDHPQMVRVEAPRDLTIHTDAIEPWRPTDVRALDRAVHHRVILEVRKRPDVTPLWVSHTPRSELTPGGTSDVPTDPSRLAALLTALIDRREAVDSASVEAANDTVGRLLRGEAWEDVVASNAAPGDVVRGTLELFARAVDAEGNRSLARDLRDAARSWPQETTGAPAEMAASVG